MSEQDNIRAFQDAMAKVERGEAELILKPQGEVTQEQIDAVEQTRLKAIQDWDNFCAQVHDILLQTLVSCNIPVSRTHTEMGYNVVDGVKHPVFDGKNPTTILFVINPRNVDYHIFSTINNPVGIARMAAESICASTLFNTPIYRSHVTRDIGNGITGLAIKSTIGNMHPKMLDYLRDNTTPEKINELFKAIKLDVDAYCNDLYEEIRDMMYEIRSNQHD